jgi:hypothetical protein
MFRKSITSRVFTRVKVSTTAARIPDRAAAVIGFGDLLLVDAEILCGPRTGIDPEKVAWLVPNLATALIGDYASTLGEPVAVARSDACGVEGGATRSRTSLAGPPLARWPPAG